MLHFSNLTAEDSNPKVSSSLSDLE